MYKITQDESTKENKNKCNVNKQNNKWNDKWWNENDEWWNELWEINSNQFVRRKRASTKAFTIRKLPI